MHETGASLFIYGKRGSGKSVLGTLILRDAIDTLKESVLYVPFQCINMEASTSNFVEHREKIEATYCDPEFLMIDEIEGCHQITPKTRDYFSNILTLRNTYHKPTIVTSRIGLNKVREELGYAVFNAITQKDNYLAPICIKMESSEIFFSKDEIYDIEVLRKNIVFKMEEQRRGGSSTGNKDTVNGKELRDIILETLKEER